MFYPTKVSTIKIVLTVSLYTVQYVSNLIRHLHLDKNALAFHKGISWD